MKDLPVQVDENLLVGHAGADDAGVYRISDDSALVLTVDFFTPVVDDPFDYGRIAATNSLSDVYAMGGRPVAALNIAGFPEGVIEPEILSEILKGGLDTARRAGIPIVGGHTVNDKEVKYGLAVVGMIDPERIISNQGARVGDVLILTKPIGTGVLSTALKNQKLDDDGIARVVSVMSHLNREASELMLERDTHAATDVTGFGLLGHANNLSKESGVSIEIDATAVPLIDGAVAGVRDGQLTGGGKTNRAFLDPVIRIADSVDEILQHLLVDPQTAGGLLIAVAESDAQPLLDALLPNHPQAAIIGRCVDRTDVNIVVS